MDKKDDSVIRPVKTSGRKVEKTTEYDWERLDRKKTGKKKPDTQKTTDGNIRLLSEKEIQKRYQKQQYRKQLKIMRIRVVMILLIVVMIAVILMFMTPIFNIKSISVTGNHVVTLEEIDKQIGDLVGQNMFRVSENTVSGRLSSLAYIDKSSVSRRLFPPSIKVTVSECQPVGYMDVNGYKLIIDTELKAVGDNNNFNTDSIPEIKGMGIQKYKLGKTIEADNVEKNDALKLCLKQMKDIGILGDIDMVDVSNVTGIEFMYQNRINVLCGSQIELERKLNLFKETILSNNIAEDAKGTVDLTVAGKAVYTP